MSLLLTRDANELLATWSDQNPMAHAAAYRLMTRITRNIHAGVPAAFLVPIQPKDLPRLDPSMRKIWQSLRQFHPDIHELMANYPGGLMQREPTGSREPAWVFSLHVCYDIRRPPPSRPASVTLLGFGTIS
jgi:hypothetical protein